MTPPAEEEKLMGIRRVASGSPHLTLMMRGGMTLLENASGADKLTVILKDTLSDL